MKAWHALKGRWKGLQARERYALSMMVAVLAGVVAWHLLWQSSRDALSRAQQDYHSQLALAAQAARAPTWREEADAVGTPSSSQLNDTAVAAGLQVKQLEIDNDTQGMTLVGDTDALLGWLHAMQQQGVVVESLTLEVQAGALQLSLVASL